MTTVHFVGLTDQQYAKVRASRVWSDYPHYYHKWWDDRVDSDVGPDDIVIYAQHVKRHTDGWVWDASAVDAKYTH